MEQTEAILGELRKLNRSYEEISVTLRGDSFWLGLHSQADHALTFLRSIPVGARWCVLLGVICLGVGAINRNGKVAAIGVDLLFLSLLFVGAQP